MKKNLLPALLVALALGLSATASFAGLQPGVSPKIWDVMKNQADAMRVKQMAYAKQIIQRNDSALGLTCFDQQMKLTAYLGSIFSDKIPDNVPPPSPSFITQLAFPDRGKTNVLPANLGQVVDPVLATMLANFEGALSMVLGAGTSSFSGWAASWLQSWMQSQFGWVPPIPMVDCARIAMLWNKDTNPPPSEEDPGNPVIGTPVCEETDPSSKRYNPAARRDPRCSKSNERVARHKAGSGGHPPVAGLQSIEGNGTQDGAPYASMKSILRGVVPGAGEDFLRQLANDRGVLQAALRDLTDMVPGGIESWPTTPPFTRDTRMEDIINAM